MRQPLPRAALGITAVCTCRVSVLQPSEKQKRWANTAALVDLRAWRAADWRGQLPPNCRESKSSAPPSPPTLHPTTTTRAGGFEVRNFSLFRNFVQFFRSCFLLVLVAGLLVPCVSPVQKCWSLRLREVWLRHRSFSAISLQFPAIRFYAP